MDFSGVQSFARASSLRNIPSPEQGASRRILWKKPGNFSTRRRGVSLVTKLLEIPNSSRFRKRARALDALMSLAQEAPGPSERRQGQWLCLPALRRDPVQLLPVLWEDRQPGSWRLAPGDNKVRPGKEDTGRDGLLLDKNIRFWSRDRSILNGTICSNSSQLILEVLTRSP